MKKAEIVQLVLDGAGMQFGKRTAERHIAHVFNTFVGQLFRTNLNNFEFYSKNVPLTADCRECTLDFPVIQTANNGSGILRAYFACDPSNSFHPAPAYAINSQVDANAMADMVFYSVTGNKIRFGKSFPEGQVEFIAVVVPEFQGYADDDYINLPTGIAQMIIEGSVASLKGEQAGKNLYKQ